MNNSNNTYNCNNHNNRYNSRYTIDMSHICTCTYVLIQNSVHTLLDFIRKPLHVCLTVSTVLIASCNTSYIYRVEYTDGTVEYYDTKPDTANRGVNTFFKIKTENIGDYEQQQ